MWRDAFPIAGGKTSALASLCSPGHSRVGIADLVKVAGVELAGAVDVVGFAEFRGKPAQGCQAVFDGATVDAALGPGAERHVNVLGLDVSRLWIAALLVKGPDEDADVAFAVLAGDVGRVGFRASVKVVEPFADASVADFLAGIELGHGSKPLDAGAEIVAVGRVDEFWALRDAGKPAQGLPLGTGKTRQGKASRPKRQIRPGKGPWRLRRQKRPLRIACSAVFRRG